MTRTATRPKSSTLTATSTQNAEKTGSKFQFHDKKWSRTGTILTAETISALRRRTPSTRPTPCSASHYEAPHELRFRERQDTLPPMFLYVVPGAHCGELSSSDLT